VTDVLALANWKVRDEQVHPKEQRKPGYPGEARISGRCPGESLSSGSSPVASIGPPDTPCPYVYYSTSGVFRSVGAHWLCSGERLHSSGTLLL